jgi:hypothetical protein
MEAVPVGMWAYGTWCNVEGWVRVCSRRRIQTVWWWVEHGGVKCVSRSRALYSRIASREPVIKQDLRPSALALLQDPKGCHAPRPAMSRSRVLECRQRNG